MSWKRYFKSVSPIGGQTFVSAPIPAETGMGGGGTTSKFSSYLPEVYSGHPNRIQRYYQYDDMDRDSDINAALDTIADFCTQSEEQNKEPFEIYYTGEPNETEVSILKTSLAKWVKLNKFRSRLWHIFRNTLKNGDAFFLRDPETGEWLWLDTFMVEMVKVDDTAGKNPEEYIVRGLDYNKQVKFATLQADPSQYRSPLGASNAAGARPQVAPQQAPSVFSLAGSNADPRQRNNLSGLQNQLCAVDAQHVVHLSLSVGMDVNWPFGASILEPIFKTYKQKELLEDSVIIYRVQRAPERRIFYIDTGSMPPVRAKAYIEQMKNEIHQRRIPNRTGGGPGILDAAYSPLGMLEDYFFAQGNDGRGSKVETLPGGEMTGEIGDLLFFSKKLARGLRIPSSYLSLGGDEEGSPTFNDGKLGAALIQEFRFNKYCMRMQALLSTAFDKDFKWYLRKNGLEIDENLFELQFMPPQNFTKYRQIEVDAQQVQVYTQLQDNKKLSERFKLKRFLNLSEEELLENESLWSEENASKLKKTTGASPAEQPTEDLSSVGIRSGAGDFDMGGEMPEEIPPEGENEQAPTGGGGGGLTPPAGGETGGPAPGGPPSGGLGGPA